MPFKVNEKYGAVVIDVRGKFLGSVEGESFKENIDRLKDAGKKQIVIDLSHADFMDSSGIGVLIGALTSLRKVGGDARLAGIEKRIKAVFLMTHLLGSVFEDYPTVEEAIQSFQTNPPAAAEGMSE
jgi:anti-sigma B factor antagonist